MPTKYKIILTLLVLIASILVACFEYASANVLYVWIIIVVTFLMIIGLWVFPEAKGKITQEK